MLRYLVICVFLYTTTSTLQERNRRQRNRRKIFDPHDGPYNRRFIHQTETRKGDHSSSRSEKMFSDRFAQTARSNTREMQSETTAGYYTSFFSCLCFRRNLWCSTGRSQNPQLSEIDKKSCDDVEEKIGAVDNKVFKGFFCVK